jgi:hypothetical protein
MGSELDTMRSRQNVAICNPIMLTDVRRRNMIY